MRRHDELSAEINRSASQQEMFYRHALVTLADHDVPFLIGGAYALEFHTGIGHRTNDLDIMVRPPDCLGALEVLSDAGYRTELTFPHWLGKAFCGEEFIDLIFNAGNATAAVDDSWFERAAHGEIFGLPVAICSPAELVWCKSCVMERERFDGADIVHLIYRCAAAIDWRHLLERFGPYWRVLLSHLVMYGFVYPGERSRIPSWVIHELFGRMQTEFDDAPDAARLCQGTLLSREQYLVDIEQWGFDDARLIPRGNMTRDQIALWTAAISGESAKKC